MSHSDSTIQTCPRCGAKRKGNLGYCTDCEHVFYDKDTTADECVQSKLSWWTWTFHLLGHICSNGLMSLIAFTIGVGFLSGAFIHFLYPNRTEEKLYWVLLGGQGVGLCAGLIYVFFQSFDYSRKKVRIRGRWKETRERTDHEGRVTGTYLVTILDTDHGMIEGKEDGFPDLPDGASVFCWTGELSPIPFLPKRAFIGRPFELLEPEEGAGDN